MCNAQNYARYLEREGIGQWCGDGAAKLDLQGEVNQLEYLRLCRGEDPCTGDSLRRLRRAERVYHRQRETAGFDKTYYPRQAYSVGVAAPKTVSIQALVDKQMLECHDRAVQTTIQELEKHCGPLVIAAYQHRISRTGDPLLHSHLVTMNTTLRSDGWRALDARPLYKEHVSLTESYRTALFGHAARMGYRVDYPELGGYDFQELYRKFSQRALERDRLIRDHREACGMAPKERISNNMVANLVYRYRPPKAAVPADKIHESLARLTQSERRGLTELAERAYEYSHKPGFQIAYGEEGQNHRQLSYGERIGL